MFPVTYSMRANGLSVAPAVFTRNSVGTVVARNKSYASIASGSPRWDYDLNAPGLLMERASTNLIANPDTPVNQTITLTAGDYTLSFYGGGTISLAGAAALTAVGSGSWPVRTVQTFTVTTGGSVTVAFTGTIDKPQLESGLSPTRYIAGGSRGAEQLLLTLSDLGTNGTGNGCTFYMDMYGYPGTGAIPGTAFFDIQAVTLGSRLVLACNANSALVYGNLLFGGTSKVQASISTPFTRGIRHKLAITCYLDQSGGTSSIQCAMDGTLSGVNTTSGTSFTPFYKAYISGNSFNLLHVDGVIYTAAYIPKMLAADELAALTRSV